VILIDAGGLLALLHVRDRHHKRIVDALSRITDPFLTTEAAVAETLHFLGKKGGWAQQHPLGDLVLRNVIELAALRTADYQRVFELMGKYADIPMDFADATLVAVAERERIDRIITVDSDFLIYRINNRKKFRIYPDPET
jgi:uncharacterized protein